MKETHSMPTPSSLGEHLIERQNAVYRRHKIEDLFFVIGLIAAIVSSVLRVPFQMWIASSVAFMVWVLSFVIYSEIYRFPSSGSLGQVLGRIQTERKQLRCFFLFILPALCRLARLILLACLRK